LFSFSLFVIVSLAELEMESNTTCGEDVPVLAPRHLNFSYWDNVVKALVTPNATKDGITLNTFDYTKLLNNPNFKTFTCQVQNAVNISQFDEDEWRAFWINVYNFLAVKVVYDNPCAIDLFGQCRVLHSIKEVFEQQPSLFDIIWSTPVLAIKDWNEGNMISLNDIEHSYLRAPPNFTEDVRIHGCIVCASVSCPDLRASAYTVQNISGEMEDNVNMWLANSKKGSFATGNAVTLSKIFLWFAGDFNNATGKTNSANMTAFLMAHAPPTVQAALRSGSATFNYFDYDWNLNGNVATLCTVDRPCFPWWALLTLILGLLVVLIVSVICVRKRKGSQYERIN